MRISISLKSAFFAVVCFALCSIISIIVLQNAVIENYVQDRRSQLNTVASSINEMMVGAKDIREDSQRMQTLDVLSSKKPERIILSDLDGHVTYDSRRSRNDTNLSRTEMRVDRSHPNAVFLLQTTSSLKTTYHPAGKIRSYLGNSENAHFVYFAPIYSGASISGQSMLIEPLTDIAPMLGRIRSLVIMIFTAIAAVIGAISYFFTRIIIVNPLLILADLTTKIARKDFQGRFETRSNDEIGFLGRSFNTMVYNLEKMVREIEEHNDGLIHLASELESRNEQMLRKQQLIEYDLRLAHNIQQELLPQVYPKIDGLLISAANFPVGEIGGDCFDFYKFDEHRLGAFIGDVSGKGIAAALVMSMVTILFGQLKDRYDSPAQILSRVNEIMYRHFGNQHSIYLTCFFLTLDMSTLTLTYSCAGHTPPLLIRPSEPDLIQLESAGFGLGMFNNVVYQDTTTQLLPGDRIILFTDGITDCRNKDGEMFGHERLVQLIKDNPKANTYKLTHYVVEALEDFAGQAPRQDDLTILVLGIREDSIGIA